MRTLLLVLVVVGAALGANVQTEEHGSSRAYEDQLNKTMECVKVLLNNGNPEIGLPSFNPLKLKDVTIDLDRFGLSFLKGHVTLKSFNFYDITKYTLTRLEGSQVSGPEALEFRVTTEWPVSKFEGEYDIDVSVLGTTVKGKGTVRETITDYGSDIKFKASLPLKLHEFSIRVFMEGFEFHIDEILLNGVNVTSEVNRKANMGVDWLKENGDVVDAFVTNIVMQIINGINRNQFDIPEIIGEVVKCWDASA